MINYNYLFKKEDSSLDPIFYNLKNLYLDLPLEKIDGYLDGNFLGFSNFFNIKGNGDKIQFLHSLPFLREQRITNINLSDGKFPNQGSQSGLLYRTNIENLKMENIIYPINFGLTLGGENIKNINLCNGKFQGYNNLSFLNYYNLKNINVENGTFCQKTYLTNLFRQCNNLLNINLSTGKNTSYIGSINNMFQNCTNIKDIDFSNGNFYSIDLLYNVFSGCTNLINLKMDNGNTSNITVGDSTFSGCYNLKDFDLSSGNTSNLIAMRNTFRFCNNANINLGNGTDLSNMQSLNGAFSYTKSIITNKDGNCFHLWHLVGTFEGTKSPSLPKLICNNLATIENCFANAHFVDNLDLSQGNVSKVQSFSKLFFNTTNLKNLNLNNGSKQTNNLKNLSNTFPYIPQKGEEDTLNEIKNFNVSNVSNFCNTFYSSYLTDVLNLSNGNVESAQDFSYCFYNGQGKKLFLQNGKFANIPSGDPNSNCLKNLLPGSINLEEINLFNGNFCNKRIGMKNLFNGIGRGSINFNVDVNNGTGLDGIISMNNAFEFLNMGSLDLSTGELSNCKRISGMFHYSDIDLKGFPNFNRNLGIDASYMFYNGRASRSGPFHFRNVAFSNVCGLLNNSFTTVDLQETSLHSACTDLNYLFHSSTGLISGGGNFLANWNTQKIDTMSYLFTRATSPEPFYHIQNGDTSSLTNLIGAFGYISNCEIINLSKGKMPLLSTASNAFANTKVRVIDLSSWQPRSSYTNLSYCFYNCTGIKELYLNSFKFNNSMNYTSIFYNFDSQCKVGVRDQEAKNILLNKQNNVQYIMVASPLSMEKINSYSIMNNTSKDLSIEFFGGSSDIKNQQLNYEIILSNQDTLQITSSIDYSKSKLNLNINAINEGTNEITINLSDTQGNVYTQTILINITPYLSRFYEIENPPTLIATVPNRYPFTLNGDGYYESTNQGKNNSYAICKLKFKTDTGKIILDCIHSAQSQYDFAILSTLDAPITNFSEYGNSDQIYKSFKNSSSYNIQTQTYTNIDEEEHFIFIKYSKNYTTNDGNDSLQFKVRFE